MFGKKRPQTRSKVRRGDAVRVRTYDEIRATLDADGTLDGLPFMPEMVRYCGRRFRVYRRANKVFLDHHYYVARLDGTVLLEGTRCDGARHDGCQMDCRVFWKEAWLEPADPTDILDEGDSAPVASSNGELPTKRGNRFCCQATELVRATSRLRWWDLRQYVRDLVSRETTVRGLFRMLCVLAGNRLRRLRRAGPSRWRSRRGEAPVNGKLDLQPGERVEVKSREEIEATLDENLRTRGLAPTDEMLAFCGKRFRVAGRVGRIVLEWSGRSRRIADTVALEGVTCDGISRRGCPRDCFHLWREAWLKRAPTPSALGT